MQQPEEQKENSLAVASLALGILSLTGASILAGIPAIITGAMAIKNPVNKGMGVAGIVMGVISTVFTILIILLFILFFGALGMMSPEYIEAPAPGADDFAPSGQQQA